MPPRLAEAVALGLIQGPAELLPVSSSAHVELLPWMLGWDHARLDGARRKELQVALHAGTAVALAAERPQLRPGLLAAATLPPSAAGLLFEDMVEQRLGTPASMAAGLIAGSLALVATDRVAQRRETGEARLADGAWLGLAQASALMPGVSRSGATRSMARALGFTRPAAKALSAEVALPILVGATLLKGVRLVQRRPSPGETAALAAGALASAASTALALRLQRRASLPAAAWAAYRTALAIAVLRIRHNRSR